MQKPKFEKVTAAKLDECIQGFFVQGLGYALVKNDPDVKPGEPQYWRMVFPTENSMPFAVAYQPKLSEMKRQDIARLYVNKVIPHRDAPPTPPQPVLYCFTDGARYVFFSADPARNRDDRFDLSEETWGIAGVQEKVEQLRFGNLQLPKRAGRVRPRVEFLFDSSPLSQDNRFKNYVHEVRRQLMKEVVADDQALGAVVYHLLEAPEARDSDGGAETKFVRLSKGKYKLKGSLDELYTELNARIGDAVAAAVDTLLLRYVMVRFLEAYHPEAMEGLLTSGEMLRRGKRVRKVASMNGRTGKQVDATLFDPEGTRASKFSDEELSLARLVSRPLAIDVSKAKNRAKGSDMMQIDLFAFGDEETGVELVLEEEAKREQRLGGDFYLADLGKAARAIEERLLRRRGAPCSRLLQDFLGRTGDTVEENGVARWQFRYEDLKPKTLQNYYEDSLSTAVQLTYDERTEEFSIDVGTSNRQRKELGAYYTNEHLCRYMVERTVKPLFDERVERLRKAVVAKDLDAARTALRSVVCMSVCDPTMGSAPFLRSAFDFLSESTQYFRLYRLIEEAKALMPAFFEEATREYPFLGAKGGKLDVNGVGAWEWHILRRMLYGVDIDLKAVCIACQTFALSSMRHLKQGERFPSFYNLNLKLGNALISPTRLSDRPELAREHQADIAKMIKLRRKAQTLPNTESSYAELVEIFKKLDEIKTPLMNELLEERVAPVIGEFTEELRPFSWELEFPEVFFEEDGTLKDVPGFDVVIGNPPWEAVKFNDNEFVNSVGAAGTSVSQLTKKNEVLAKAYRHYLDSFEAWKDWINLGGQYEHQQGGRYRNKWRLATEVSWKLTAGHGAMSLVIPGGIIADDGGSALKRWIFPEGESHAFISFEKENDVFTGSQAFTVTTFRRGRPTKNLQHIEGLTQAEQLWDLPYVPVSMPLQLIEEMSPDVLAIPSVRDDIDKSLLEKLYRHPLITDDRAPWRAVTVSYDYNMGHGRPFFNRDGKGIPLLEGKSVEQYESLPEDEIRIRVSKRKQSEPGGQYRVACADIAGTLDARRMLSTLVPHGYATGDKLNCFLVEGGDSERLYLVGVLNSFVVEWRVRQLARSNNVKRFMLVQLPIPRPPKESVDRVASLVASLITADSRFSDLKGLLNGRSPARSDEARHELKCQIDAGVAHLFGLTEPELERVLSVFDKVPEKTKDLVKKYFRESAGATT